MLDGKSVLVTGGTGSFGKAFVGIVLKRYKPRRLIVFSRDELKQHEMRQVYPDGDDSPMRYFIGDVRSPARLHLALYDVDIVVHAAALKQVPACEYNPTEAIETNIWGVRNVIDAAIEDGVKQVIALSTDKSTAPSTLYGATKLVGEKLFVQANAYSGQRVTRFSCVRYGNVIGSRGSVIPLWREQAKSGAVTITHPDMTRFLITLPQAVEFVLSSLAMMHGGEVFVPKLPSMRMDDLAEVVAPDTKKQLIGVRAGEKLHEAMVSDVESMRTVDLGDRYAILPAHPWWSQHNYPDAKPVADGWSYSSDTNEWWLTLEEARQLIGNT